MYMYSPTICMNYNHESQYTYSNVIKLMVPQNKSGIMVNLHIDRELVISPKMQRKIHFPQEYTRQAPI